MEISANDECDERLHEEFKRRIKTQTVLPSAETAAMLFWSLLASGQITMRKVDGWHSLGQPLSSMPLDLAADPIIVPTPETPPAAISTSSATHRQKRRGRHAGLLLEPCAPRLLRLGQGPCSDRH